MIPKFRAWMKSLKWMCDVTNISFDSKFVDICQQGDTERYTEMSVEFDEIELMQSTGLFDKNNKEIFEGDVIANGPDVMCMKRHNTLGFYVEKKGKVEFIADGAVLEEFEEDAKEIVDSLEIVGNIYENKNILEEKK